MLCAYPTTFAYSMGTALLLLVVAMLLIFTSTSSVVIPTSSFKNEQPATVGDFEQP